MSYVKLPKVIQDFTLGFRKINQAHDNTEATRGIYQPEHQTADLAGIGFSNAPPLSVAPYGSHLAPHIPKSVATVTAGSNTLTNGTTFTVITVGLTGRCIKKVSRKGVGIFFIETDALNNAWANATPIGTTTPRKCLCRPLSLLGNNMQGWSVTLLELAAGDFSPADYNFHFRLWAES